MKKKLTKVIESDLLRDAYKKWRKQPKGGGRGREATKLNQAKNRGFF